VQDETVEEELVEAAGSGADTEEAEEDSEARLAEVEAGDEPESVLDDDAEAAA
jgi:hypothetical protein